jgi:hypothetical protein
MSEERFDRIESQLQVLETRLRTDVTELRRYMGVIHEDLVDRIRGGGDAGGSASAGVEQRPPASARGDRPALAAARGHRGSTLEGH